MGPPGPYPQAGSAADLQTSAPAWATPAHVAKPTRPGPGRPKGSARGPAPRYPVPKKTGNLSETGTPHGKSQVKT